MASVRGDKKGDGEVSEDGLHGKLVTVGNTLEHVTDVGKDSLNSRQFLADTEVFCHGDGACTAFNIQGQVAEISTESSTLASNGNDAGPAADLDSLGNFDLVRSLNHLHCVKIPDLTKK